MRKLSSPEMSAAMIIQWSFTWPPAAALAVSDSLSTMSSKPQLFLTNRMVFLIVQTPRKHCRQAQRSSLYVDNNVAPTIVLTILGELQAYGRPGHPCQTLPCSATILSPFRKSQSHQHLSIATFWWGGSSAPGTVSYTGFVFKVFTSFRLAQNPH